MVFALAAGFSIKLISLSRRACLKAFGVAEVLSLLAKKVPKETSPGIARKPAKKFVRQGAVVTRTALPSRCSDIRRLKTLANDFLSARFTGRARATATAKSTTKRTDSQECCRNCPKAQTYTLNRVTTRWHMFVSYTSRIKQTSKPKA